MRYAVLVLVVGLLVCGLVYADIPRLTNFQGRLTDSSGKFVPDGNYSLTFRIYTDSTGGSAKWSEGQLVAVSKGLFNVLLGSANPVPESIFNYSNTWLGIQVGADPEMTPRQRLSSLGYAYRGAKADTSSYSMNSDKLDGLHASDFSSPATDYGRSGVATDLYEGTSTLTSKYVNSTGPEGVSSSTGTAFMGYAWGNSYIDMAGIEGIVRNYGATAYGGKFYAYPDGVGNHYGVYGESHTNSSKNSYGAYGYGDNASTGPAYGGYFQTTDSGTGNHYGVYGFAYGNSSSTSYGSYGVASNNSTGDAYGAFFQATANGTGYHIGVYGSAYNNSSSSPVYGFYGFAQNSSTGNVYGGYFDASFVGTGTKYGVYAKALSGYAGYFEGSTLTTGTKSAAVKMNSGEYRLLYAMESPENWFEDFREGQLINGRTHIELDPTFLQTVTINNLHPMKVFIQLTSGVPMNVVINKETTGFEVVASDNTSNATFDYRVVAKRKGFEDLRLAKMIGPTPEEMAAERAKIQAETEKETAKMEEDRIRMKKEMEKEVK